MTSNQVVRQVRRMAEAVAYRAPGVEDHNDAVWTTVISAISAVEGAVAPTRAELIELMEAAYRRNLSRLSVGSEECFGDWSARDLLVHLETWERWYAIRLAALREGREASAVELYGTGGPLPDEQSWDTDEINAWVEERGREFSHPGALSRYEQTHATLVALVDSLTDYELARPSGLGGPHALWFELGWESYLHSDSHLGPSSPEKTGPIPSQT